jgi:phosphotransferase system enzyme I (PtsP)
MIAEVSSIYVRLPDDSLELFATEGLRKEAVHTLRMKKGEGLVGLIADWGEPINLTDAQKHANYSYKPETGEEIYHSFLGVPMVRDRRTIGVLTVQNKIERRYTDEEVEALETTAMVLAEMIASGNFAGAVVAGADRREASVTLTGIPLNEGLALGHIALHEPRPQVLKFFADSIPAELKRLTRPCRLREDIACRQRRDVERRAQRDHRDGADARPRPRLGAAHARGRLGGAHGGGRGRARAAEPAHAAYEDRR